MPEWRLSSGHAHPDAGQLHHLGRAGATSRVTPGTPAQPQARHHNTITVGGIGQGDEGDHDVWQGMAQAALDTVRITVEATSAAGLRVEADAPARILRLRG